MKTNTVITIIVIALILLALYYIYKKQSEKSAKNSETVLQNFINNNTGSAFPIQVGSKGERVKEIQKAINAKVPFDIPVDGIFGEQTKTAFISAYGAQNYPISEQVYNWLI